ncbi:hypothetical protein [Paracoccus thiocyanatus]|uniref:Uncharacterized protein n=1 Tax=Paracoccus thiocyanatus TaxID=34006 RepID=A0A3D8PGQ4_9RHOB|nr:hypothetical protein [Paracoccus thiocyanatus]RDW14421.1 hypothetical protein DIE28_02640 [Paracoccus thiocyanatus]
MTNGKLIFEDGVELTGTVDLGGDYAIFKTDTVLSQDQTGTLKTGELQANDRKEKVLLETAQAIHADQLDKGEPQGTKLTLRRFDPI